MIMSKVKAAQKSREEPPPVKRKEKHLTVKPYSTESMLRKQRLGLPRDKNV